MVKVIKKIVITLLIIALVAGGIYGGLILYRNANREPVNVFAVSDFYTENWYGGESYTYGMVTADKLQKVYVSDTQNVTEVYVTEGQEVKKGDPILSYDTTLSDIDLEKASISHQKLLAELDEANKELQVISALEPHRTVVIRAEQKEIEYIAEPTPELYSGTGALDDPFYWIMSFEDALTDEMIEEMYQKRLELLAEENAAEETEESPETEEAGDEAAEESAETEDAVSLFRRRDDRPARGSEEASEETPEEGSSEGPSEESSAEPEEPAEDPEENPEEEPWEEPVVFYAAFVTRDQDALNGMVLSEWGLQFEKTETGFRYFYYYPVLPEEVYEYEEQPEDVWQEYGSDYTAEEIASMKKAKEEEIQALKEEILLSEVNLERLQQEISDGKVYAKLDGTIKTLRDPGECRYSGEAAVELSAGGGYYIEVTMGEYDLDAMEIGQTVTVNSWQTGAVCEGTVIEIGTDPVEENNGWSSGSSHVSYYPFTVFVSEDENLMENDYVDVTYTTAASAGSTDSWYLEKVFIRSGGGKSWVYVKGEDGLLEKRIIQTGKTLDDYYTEIRGGLTLDDRVAFPYGNDVKEGAETVDADAETFYSALY